MTGFAVRCRGRRGPGLLRGHAQAGQGVQQGRLAGQPAVEVDMHQARRAGLGLQHAGQALQMAGHGFRAPRVAYPFHLPQHMREAFGDAGAGGLGQLADAGQRQGLRIEVDAQLRRCVSCGFADMDLVYALAALQVLQEPLHDGVVRVGNLGQHQGDVEAELVGHGGSCVRRQACWPLAHQGHATWGRLAGVRGNGWPHAPIERPGPM